MTLDPGFAKFAELTAAKRELEAELAGLKSELAELNERLPDLMVEQGIDKITVDGYTLYPSSRNWARAKAGSEQALKDALEARGFGDIVKPNSVSLSALWNDYDGGDEGVPEWLSEITEINTKITLKARRAAK